MRYELRLIFFLLIGFFVCRIVISAVGLSKYYVDLFLPSLPFFVNFGSFTIIPLFIITGLLSSIIYYDEMFATLLGYGVSLLLLLNLSKKYSLNNFFNYLISVLLTSLIVFLINMLAYFAKDRIIVASEVYQFVTMNILSAIMYFYVYQILVHKRAAEDVKR